MCPQTVVSCGDTKAGSKVIDNGPNECRKTKRSPGSVDESDDWDNEDEDDVKPIDVLVPILFRHWLIGDVWLAWAVFLVAIWLRGLGLGVTSLVGQLEGVNSHHALGGLVGRHLVPVE